MKVLGKRVTLSELKAGDRVFVGYGTWDGTEKDEDASVEFLGFSDWGEQFSIEPMFSTYDELKAALEVTNAKELKAKVEALEAELGQGHTPYALFRMNEENEGAIFGAYLHKGTWSVGSSADAAKVSLAVEQDDKIELVQKTATLMVG